jgi:hypothetical protein
MRSAKGGLFPTGERILNGLRRRIQIAQDRCETGTREKRKPEDRSLVLRT